MNQKISKPKNQVELLAPAKNFMAIKASGPYADAVYFGIEDFNMRINADNFRIEEMAKIVERCHHPSHSDHRIRKAYLTTNILVYEDELEKLEEVIRAAKEANVDAVIVHDLAAIEMAKQIKIPFHISTQCNVSNALAAKSYERMGAERIILARECSLNQISEISKQMKTSEIEAFIHGAMCSSISGRCYLSQTLAGTNVQSANRGACTQPCRGEWQLIAPNNHEFIFDGQRIFNSRDLCMINYIPELIQAGIKSFKIEGRMRHPHYVETVTRIYREAIDAFYAGEFDKKKKESGWITQLKQVYNRGFTTGFYFNQATIKDSQLNAPSNLSHYRYINMGSISTYLTKSQVAQIELTNGSLQVGDEIIIMSTNRDYETYFRQIISDIRIDGTDVQKTPLATDSKPILITTKMNERVNRDGIDAIYKFTNETYKPISHSKKFENHAKGYKKSGKKRRSRKANYRLK